MSARTFMAIVAVFIAWSVIGFLVHGILLQDAYVASSELWRPIGEMKMPLMYSVTLAASICFVLVYSCLVSRKSLDAGIKLGLLLGLASGISMGFGSYSYMPISMTMAQAWFAAALVEGLLAGILVGSIIVPQDEVA